MAVPAGSILQKKINLQQKYAIGQYVLFFKNTNLHEQGKF